MFGLGYAKALVPVVVGVVLYVLGLVGVNDQLNVREALTLAISAGLVWFVPNRK